jgi:hypothetical protein
MAVEAVIDTRNRRSPHKYYDAQIIQLIPEFLHLRAVVIDYVISGWKFV